jgi:hypothetical protein
MTSLRHKRLLDRSTGSGKEGTGKDQGRNKVCHAHAATARLRHEEMLQLAMYRLISHRINPEHPNGIPVIQSAFQRQLNYSSF